MSKYECPLTNDNVHIYRTGIYGATLDEGSTVVVAMDYQLVENISTMPIYPCNNI